MCDLLLLYYYFLITSSLIFRVLTSPEKTLQGHEEPVIIFSQSWSTELHDISVCLQGDCSEQKIKLFDQKTNINYKTFLHVIVHYFL